MKKYLKFPATFAAVSVLFGIVACTDVAEPIAISKSAESQAAAHGDGQDAPRISLAEAKKAFDERSATFIDTHPQQTYDAGHIPGAINITVQDLESKFDSIPKGKRIIAYCS
jgi:3-mercaptopyruvate sulfurtransferase SseA